MSVNVQMSTHLKIKVTVRRALQLDTINQHDLQPNANSLKKYLCTDDLWFKDPKNQSRAF